MAKSNARREDLELTAGSVEQVREPARGTQEFLALETTGTRHTHAQTYMQATTHT